MSNPQKRKRIYDQIVRVEATPEPTKVAPEVVTPEVVEVV